MSDQPAPAVVTPDPPPADPAPAETKKTPAQVAAEAEANEPREDKIRRLIEGYEHGLASNAPRTSAELAELKALLEG
jgi:hypothetical protein